ncbi:MAG: enoyl-CoA hydratase-related protein, partial [Acidobacteria bacterium]|nr:enoyl-CoA hydratase-related protein [Acidobacteriota bacterium]
MLTRYENLLVEANAPIARVTLNRPERRNALSLALMKELTACLREIGESKEIQVVILSGAGTVFSSGHDLGEMRGCSISDYRNIFALCVELMTTVQSIPQPVIAEVQGIATAAG